MVSSSLNDGVGRTDSHRKKKKIEEGTFKKPATQPCIRREEMRSKLQTQGSVCLFHIGSRGCGGPAYCDQLLLNNPIATFAMIKATIAEAAMPTATAMRKSNKIIVMMFFSITSSWNVMRLFSHPSMQEMYPEPHNGRG
jgi:hypothetical protein